MANIRIELYRPEYKEDFIRLNTEWITTFFKIEESDILALNNVEEYIIGKGGQIFLAIDENRGEVLGCCALIKHPDTGTTEMGKMAVTPKAQGLGLGRKLGQALIDYARQNGIKKIFLEGNTKMEASIILYRKLGFEEVPISEASYERCDIMMTLDIK
ncbi:MAG: GNAT family N-acetyltransferase [Dysgonomonas sp.]